MQNQWYLINGIGSIAIYFIGFVITTSILTVECMKRKRIKKSGNVEAEIQSQTQKWLNIFSIMVMIVSITANLFGMTQELPFTCIYGYALDNASFALIQYFLTFYQISRLHYSFSSEQVHHKYGYSNKLFIVLYSYGTIFALYSITQCWFIYKSQSDQNGFACIHAITHLYNPLGYLYTSFYYIWDWFVLSLYIYKYFQIRKFLHNKYGNETSVKVLKRVKFILQKIISLTLVYEIYGLSAIAIDRFIRGYEFWMILTATVTLHSVITSFIIYFMIEHNNEIYLKFINVLCCRSTNHDHNDTESKGVKSFSSDDETMCQTGTNAQSELQIHSVQMMSVEQTETYETGKDISSLK